MDGMRIEGTTNETTSVGDVLSLDPKHGAKRVAGLQKIIYERKNSLRIRRRGSVSASELHVMRVERVGPSDVDLRDCGLQPFTTTTKSSI